MDREFVQLFLLPYHHGLEHSASVNPAIVFLLGSSSCGNISYLLTLDRQGNHWMSISHSPSDRCALVILILRYTCILY